MRPHARLFLPLLLAVQCVVAQGPSLPAGTRFIMSHFKADGGGGDERLYISISPDGASWTAINGGAPVWQPPGWAGFTNVVRDPSILYADGMFWVAYTSGTYGRHASFALIKSSDLLNWTFVGDIGTAIPGATDSLTWGPIFFRDGDGSVHILVAISLTGGASFNPTPDLRVHEMHPLDAGFTQWSTPVPLPLPTTNGATNTNECYVWKEGSTYHAIYVDFSPGFWAHATAPALLGPWSSYQFLGFAPQEGGNMLVRPGGGYRFYLEPGNGSGAYRYYDLTAGFAQTGPPVSVAATVEMRNGKIIAAPATTHYADWQAQHLSALPAAQQLPTADPDGDSRTNLLEFSTALDPLTPDASAPAAGLLVTDVGGEKFLALRYRRMPSAADAALTLEVSNDLAQWLPATCITRAVTLASDGSEIIEVVDTVPVGSSAGRFLRLKATLTPP